MAIAGSTLYFFRYGRQATEQTVGGVFFHLVEHEIHHRAFVLNKLAKLESPSPA